ncbi:hypothetical protein OAG10_04880, partial [Verrucomicrobia bacterium]|nr:hypothetical protein [Verrucomicrobiota bacterium]
RGFQQESVLLSAKLRARVWSAFELKLIPVQKTIFKTRANAIADLICLNRQESQKRPNPKINKPFTTQRFSINF